MSQATSTRGPEAPPTRTAVVTGASSGVGRAVAVAFGTLGWRVALGARRADKVGETAALVEQAGRDAGGEALALALDVTDTESVEAFFDRVTEAYGLPDILVNNAGLGLLGSIADSPPERNEVQFATNVLGSIACASRFIRDLQAAGRPGDLVFISSESVNQLYPHMLVYGATKAAIEYISQGLLIELRGTGIRPSLIRLGPTVSDFNTGWDDQDLVGFVEAWERLGMGSQDFNFIPAEAAAAGVVQVVTAPPGTRIPILAIGPEETVSASAKERWAAAESQGR